MTVSREKLYEEVWAEPMVKVAARYDVSSSFLARICARINVPRPSRGYWAQLLVGKAEAKPPLPAARPGDEVEWSREGVAKRMPRELPKAPVKRARPLEKRSDLPQRHQLVEDAREQFEGAKVLDTGYLRPAKRRLVDISVTKTSLKRAMDVATSLFLALESRGHRVVLAPVNEPLARADLEVRSEGGKLSMHAHWRPDRATVVYIGTVAIGLSLFEFTEEVAVRWLDGKYVRVSEAASRGHRSQSASTWLTKRDMPGGKLGFRASSPYPRTSWVRQWNESDGSDLSAKASRIAAELESAAPKIAELVEQATRQEEADRKEREAAYEKWRREDLERRRLQNIKDSHADLLASIDEWGAIRRIESFFEAVERQAATLEDERAGKVRDRVRRARALIGEADALGRLLTWKAPEERSTERPDPFGLYGQRTNR